MSRTESSMVQLGTIAPDFSLVNVLTGKLTNLAELRGPGKRAGLLIMFVCVHCPYVKHVEHELARIGSDYYGEAGDGPIAIAAIQSNDIEQYPEDGPEAAPTKPPAPLTFSSSTPKCASPIVVSSMPAAPAAKTLATTSP